MNIDDAREVLLKDRLLSAYHLIEFMHDRLTQPEHNTYMYPENTEEELKEIESLIRIPQGCFHSIDADGCAACIDRNRRRREVHEAKEILGL